MKTLTAVAYKPKYSFQEIQNVAKFQNYGGNVKSMHKTCQAIEATDWDPHLTKYSGVLYRVMVIDKRLYDSIDSGKPYKNETYSSWSKSKKIAENFAKEYWFQDYASNIKGTPVGILMAAMTRDKVVLDIDGLHRDKEFLRSRDFYENAGKWFNEGLDIGYSQREVMVKPFVLTRNHINKVLKV